MTGAAIILNCLLAAVEITVSPDQPLGFSYTDDPLIVEIRSDASLTTDVRVALTPPEGGAAVQQDFPGTTLGPEVNRWCALKDLPAIRGPWNVTVTIGTEAETTPHEAVVYRIDRPTGAYSHPLYAFGDQIDRNVLLALRSVAISQVRIPASHPDLVALLSEMAALNMQAIVALQDPAHAAATAAALAESSCGTVARWELEATPENAAALAGALEAIQALPCSLPISLGIRDLAALPAILAELGPVSVVHLAVREEANGPSVLDAVRNAIAGPGNEAPAVEYLYEGTGTETFLQALFEAQAHGAARVGFPVALVMQGDALQPGLAYLNGLAHGIAPATYAGSLPHAGSRHTYLFAAGESWTMAFWDGDGALELPWSPEAPFRLLDSWGNSIKIDAPEGERWSCPVSTGVRFLQGTGGPVLKATLEAEVQSAVKRLLARKDLASVWSESVRATLAAVGDAPVSDQSRVYFFALLRAFPDIEEHWHAGEIARPEAVAALAGLESLTRTLCRLEAARGASFLEPIQDTLARCEEYQSRYLTGSTTTPQARIRGDWLVEEVRRLMDEVESLLASGAKIEADAVAALAEWRARSLEFAAKAGPLSDQLTLPKPEPAPEPEKKPTETKKGKKKK